MPYCYEHNRRVPYRDCTPQGLLRPRHYLDYFKAARVNALRALGVRYRSLEDGGVLMPVVSAAVSSPKPVPYDELLAIEVCFSDTTHARLSTQYTVSPGSAADDAVLATGQVTVCFVSAETQRPVRPPKPVQRALRNARAQTRRTD